MCDYKNFLPFITAAIFQKNKTTDSVDDQEFESIVNLTFIETVSAFARESRLYEKTVSVNVYEGTTDYPITAPEGYTLVETERQLTTDCDLKADIINNVLVVNQCPTEDYPNAFQVVVSVIPNDCSQISDDFCNRYREVILDGMYSRLYAMKGRTWYDLNASLAADDRYQRKWNEFVRETLVFNNRDDDYTLFMSEALPLFATSDKENKRPIRFRELQGWFQRLFRSTMVDYLRESKSYRTIVPVSIYTGSTWAEVNPPKGFYINHVDHLIGDVDSSFSVDGNKIVFNSCVETDECYHAEVSLVPDNNVCYFDPEFLSKHYQVIYNGVLSKLHALVTAPWFDRELSNRYRAEYLTELDKIRKVRKKIKIAEDDYTLFLSEVLPMLSHIAPDNLDNLLDEQEIHNLVANAFSSTMLDYTRRTRSMRVRIPVSIYEGVTSYPVVAPKGYLLIEIEKLLGDIPATISKNTITLDNCPTESCNNGLFAEVSIVPSVNICKFDPTYLMEHFSAIQSGILYRLHSDNTKPWYNQDLADRNEGRYNRYIDDHLQEELDTLIDESGAGDYTMFVGAVIDLMKDSKITREELTRSVKVAFKDAIIDFITKSRKYEFEIPIDLYGGVENYPVPEIEGFHIDKISNVKQVSSMTPTFRVEDDSIILDRTLVVDCPRALVATVSYIPKRDTCQFDKNFVDRYYEVIKTRMFMNLVLTSKTKWRNLGVYDRLIQRYDELYTRSVNRIYDQPIQITKRRISK